MTDELPSALLEEVFWPDQIVALDQEDGTVRLLMYCGPSEGGFVALKHAVLTPEHAVGLGIKPPQPDLFSGTAEPEVLSERAPTRDARETRARAILEAEAAIARLG